MALHQGSTYVALMMWLSTAHAEGLSASRANNCQLEDQEGSSSQDLSKILYL
jgi:hypothetical protein